MNTHKMHFWLLGSLIGSGLAVGVARAQEAAPQAEAPVAPAIAVTTPDAARAWRNDARLNTKISLEAKRMPLAQVLDALSKQSGVALDGGALSATKRVTLSVTDMDAREVMTALEDLYQATWQPRGEAAGGYVLQARAMLPWQRNLAQLGNIHYWGFYRTNGDRSYAPPYLTRRYAFGWDALMNELGEEPLQSPQGVLFSSLPPATQKEIRRVTSWEVQHQAIEATARREAAERDWMLMVKPENYPHPAITRKFKVPVPAVLGPPVGEVLSGDSALATFIFKPLPQPEADEPQPAAAQ